MKLPILLLLIVCYLTLPSQSWIAVEEFDKTRNSSGHCFEVHYGMGDMAEKETRRVENVCAEASCQHNRDVKVTGCAPVVANPPCFVMNGNLSKPFPDCCYEIRCEPDYVVNLEN